jgi:hypothetical protein
MRTVSRGIDSLRRQRNESTRTMRPPNAMRREHGATTRTKSMPQPNPPSGCVFILIAPHTYEPRDVPKCGALGLLQKQLHHRGVQQNSLLG